MHPLGPVPRFRAIQYSSFPAQLIPNPISLAGRSISRLFTLRRVSETVAMATREDCAAVEDGNAMTAPTGRAEEPMPLTAHMAGCGIEMNWIAFVLPFPPSIPLAIVQDYAVRFRPDIDRVGNFATMGPRNATAYP